MRTVSAIVRWFGRRIVRRFVVLKDTRYFAKQAPFFLAIGRRRTCLASWLSARGRGRKGFIASQTKHAREEAAQAIALVAGLVWFRAGNEGCGVGIWTGRGRQPVRELIQLHVHDAGGLAERLHIRVLRQRDCLLHELRPNGCGGLGSP